MMPPGLSQVPTLDASPTDEADGSRRILLALVGLAAALVYVNSLANGFAYDDVWVIQRRDLLHDLGRLPDVLVAQYWPEELGAGLFRPITLLTYAVEWALWGGEPVGFHLTNVVLHAAVSVLVASLLLRFFRPWIALAGALVFAVHPVHTEAVANVVGRAELLTGLFVLSACLVYTHASDRGSITAPRIAAIGALYVLAMLSKESGVLLPALMLVLDVPLRRLEAVGRIGDYIGRRTRLILVLCALLASYLALRWAVLGTLFGVPPDRAFAPDDSFPTRLFTMARVWPRYFELLFFPVELSADYSPAVILPTGRLTWMGALGFGLVAITLAIAILAWRRAPELTAAVGWVAVSLLPVSNLLFTGQFVLAERTFYLPSVALSIGVGWVLTHARGGLRRALVGAVAVWILGFSLVTVRRNPVWEATHTVWDDVRRKHPESSKLVWGLGEQYLGQGDWSNARRMFRRSLELWPYHEPYVVEFALHLMERGEFEEAERYAAHAVSLNPEHADYYVLLAFVHWRSGAPSRALGAIRRGLEQAGEDGSLLALRADIEASLGNHAAAAEAQRRSIEATANAVQADAWLRLARFRAAAGDTAGALVAIERSRRAANPSRSAIDSLERALDVEAPPEGGR